MICPRDRAADRSALPISGPAFRLLRYLQGQPTSAVEALTLSPQLRAEVERLLRAYLRQLLERDLKSVTFLDDVKGVA
jgi:DNA repair protein RecO (recombination protein O)